MIKKLLLIFIMLLSSYSFCFAQSIDTQYFSNYAESKIFELDEIYHNHKKELHPFLQKLHRANRYLWLDRDEEALPILAELYNQATEERIEPYLRCLLSYAILDSFVKTKNKEDFKLWEDYLKNYIKANPDSLPEQTLKNYETSIDHTKANLSYHLTINLSSVPSEENFVLKTDTINTHLIKLPALVNDKPAKVLFDTGVTNIPMFMNKVAADSLGVKYRMRDSLLVNQVMMSVSEGVLDSLTIGEMKYYNIPFIVKDLPHVRNVPDSLKNDKDFCQRLKRVEAEMMNPVIGFDLIKLMGKMQFDFEKNELLVYGKKNIHLDSLDLSKPIDMAYSTNLALQIKIKVSNQLLNAFFDTGSDTYLYVNEVFYQQHKNILPLKAKDKSEEPMYIFTVHGIKAVDEKDINLQSLEFQGRELKVAKDERIKLNQEGNYEVNTRDGMLGLPWLRSLGKKVVLDLLNFKIEVVEEWAKNEEKASSDHD